MSDFEEYPNAIQIGDTLYKNLPPDLFVFVQEQIARAEQAESDLAKCREEKAQLEFVLNAHRTKDFSINGVFTGIECPICDQKMLKDNGSGYHCHLCGANYVYSQIKANAEQGDDSATP